MGDSTLEHQEKQVSKLYKNSWKVYKACDKFLMWDSLGSVTIDTNTIVQVGESEYVNTLGDLSSSTEISQYFIVGGKDMERYVLRRWFCVEVRESIQNHRRILFENYLQKLFGSAADSVRPGSGGGAGDLQSRCL